jgi:hypothetical protein
MLEYDGAFGYESQDLWMKLNLMRRGNLPLAKPQLTPRKNNYADYQQPIFDMLWAERDFVVPRDLIAQKIYHTADNEDIEAIAGHIHILRKRVTVPIFAAYGIGWAVGVKDVDLTQRTAEALYFLNQHAQTWHSVNELAQEMYGYVTIQRLRNTTWNVGKLMDKKQHRETYEIETSRSGKGYRFSVLTH